MNYIIVAVQYLYDALKKKDEQINGINSQLGVFNRTDDANENVRKAIQTCKKYSDDEVSKVLTRLK